MIGEQKRYVSGTVSTLVLALVFATTMSAQTRVVLPEGSVILVKTAGPLESSTAKAGQTFETIPVCLSGLLILWRRPEEIGKHSTAHNRIRA